MNPQIFGVPGGVGAGINYENDEFSSFGTNGYALLPTGLMVQWGTTAAIAASTTGVAVTFPVPFNNACLYVNYIGTTTRSAAAEANNTVTAKSTTGFSVAHGYGTTQAVNWIAIGY